MAEKKKYNSILVSGRKDETLTYTKYIKDEESGESVKESLDKKVNVTDKLETQQIKDGAITNEKMAAGSVGNTNLQDGSVSNEKLEDGSITNEKLAENSITKDKLKDNTIGIEKLDPELRQTIDAATGLPNDLVETIQNVNDTLRDHQSQLDDKQQQITANDEDISLLQTRSNQMEETIKSIAATGGASQATAVTYNNEKSKLTAVNIQSAVDEVVDKASIKDEEGNVQDTPFRVIENEEFIKAVVDSEDRIIYGIYRDTGKPYYPQNEMYHISQSEEFLWVILDAANHPLLGIQQDGTCWAAKAQWLDDIKTIKEALSSIDETLKTFQQKEDGKGLINLDVADSFFYISNDEYIIAVVDAENRILAGIKYDGEPYFPNHEMYSVITNEEWLYAIIDTEYKLLGGFRANDGHMFVGGIDISTFISDAIIDIADIKERIAHLSTIGNDEYLSVETDAEGNVIGYIAPDGSHYLYKVKSETIPTEFSHIEDPEGRIEITTDAEDKVIGYRDSKGTYHNLLPVSFDSIKITPKGVSDLAKSLKGYGVDIIDWSGEDVVEIPNPTSCAIINLTTDSQAESKTANIKCYIEFWDKHGNYFKKPIILNAQGSSSMAYDFKNQSLDLDDGSKLKIGNWLPMDSFHLKKFFIDVFRGQCIAGYWLGEQIYQTRPYGQRRPWDYLKATPTGNGSASGNFSEDFADGALSHPDGFPCKVFFNGVNAGIYSFNIKKDRSNYNCNKKNQKNIILDGALGSAFFNANGDSTKGNTEKGFWADFEVRNPKISKDINGNPYDGDSPTEPSEDYAEAKGYITALTKVLPAIKAASTKESKKEIFSKSFNVDFFIDYFLHAQVTYNYDGFFKNWIWLCNDGKLWTPTLYDLDSLFGQHWNGTENVGGTNDILGTSEDLPSGVLLSLYKSEIDLRYKELRDKAIFSVDNIVYLLEKWINKCGIENLKEDITEITLGKAIKSDGSILENVPVTPSYRSGEYSYAHSPISGGWYNSLSRVRSWLIERISYLDNYFNYNI